MSKHGNIKWRVASETSRIFGISEAELKGLSEHGVVGMMVVDGVNYYSVDDCLTLRKERAI